MGNTYYSTLGVNCLKVILCLQFPESKINIGHLRPHQRANFIKRNRDRAEINYIE